MTTLLRRKHETETIGVEVFSSLDGEGAPSYAASVNVSGVAVQEDEVVVGSDGSNERTTLTVYIDGNEDVLPNTDDRLTVDSTKYIVRERKAVLTFKNEVDHVRLRCREE